MGYCVLSRKEIADLFDKQKIGDAYVNYIDFPFLPVGLLVDELEKRKEKSVLPQQLIGYIKKMPAQVFHISLNSRNLVEALQDEEIVNQFVSSQSNPFAFMSEVCLFDDSVSSWADQRELRESLHQIGGL